MAHYVDSEVKTIQVDAVPSHAPSEIEFTCGPIDPAIPSTSTDEANTMSDPCSGEPHTCR